MTGSYVYVSSDGVEEQLLKTLVEHGVTLDWWERRFDCIGGRVPPERGEEINSSVEALDSVCAIERARVSPGEDVLIEDTENAVLEPGFDLEEYGFGKAHETVAETAPDDRFVPRIAVIDSGIDTRNDRIEHVTERINLTDEEALDSTGHGTVTASVLGYAMPFEKEIVDVKVAGRSGTTEGAVIRALGECLRRDVDVINLGLGFPGHETKDLCPLCRAAEATVSSGVLVTAAAGNHGRPGSPMPEPECPARSEEVLAAGSVNDRKRPKYYSGSGDLFVEDEWRVHVPRE